MGVYLIVGFTSEEAAANVSREFYNLSRPSSDQVKSTLVTQYAVGYRQHPENEEWACVVPEDFNIPVSPLFSATPSLLTPVHITPLLTSPATTVAALLNSERIGLDFILNHVKTEFLLNEETATEQGWFTDSNV
jgi:hypothetical protein